MADDITQSTVAAIRAEVGEHADEILEAMKRDEGEARRAQQRAAEEFLMKKAVEESQKEASRKVQERAQISESLMQDVLQAAEGDDKKAAEILANMVGASEEAPKAAPITESVMVREAVELSKKEAEAQAEAERKQYELLQRQAAQRREEENKRRRQAEAEARKAKQEAQRAKVKAEEEAAAAARAAAKAAAEAEAAEAAKAAKAAAESPKKREDDIWAKLQAEADYKSPVPEPEPKLERTHDPQANADPIESLEIGQLMARQQNAPEVDWQNWLDSSVMGPPMITIYTLNQDDSSVAELKAYLTSLDPAVKTTDIATHDVTLDFELQSWLKENSPSDTYPIVTIHGNVVGDKAALLVQKERILSLLQGEPSPPPEPPQHISSEFTIMDSVLNGTEAVLSGVKSLISLPVTVLTWPFSSSKKEEVPPDFVEIECLHQNWYHRNTLRIFRLTQKELVRLHPSQKDIRGIHPYATITSISVLNPKQVLIKYNDGSAPDLLKASEQDILTLIQTIQARAPKPIQLLDS